MGLLLAVACSSIPRKTLDRHKLRSPRILTRWSAIVVPYLLAASYRSSRRTLELTGRSRDEPGRAACYRVTQPQTMITQKSLPQHTALLSNRRARARRGCGRLSKLFGDSLISLFQASSGRDVCSTRLRLPSLSAIRQYASRQQFPLTPASTQKTRPRTVFPKEKTC